MGTIKKFEEIKAWQSARELVNLVYQVTKSRNFSKDYWLRDQIRRAAGSSMHNIAEGFDAGTTAEFIRFLRYALRSASETQSQLYTALDQAYITNEDFQLIFNKAEETKRYIHGFIAYLIKQKRSIKEENEEYEVKIPEEDIY